MLLDRFGAQASPRQRSECPGCHGEIRAKCGSIVIWHWAHVASDCDPWSEPESQWHLQWKSDLQAAGAAVEVVIGCHRADAVLPDGTVVELQSSYLSADQIAERERFYGARLIWIYRAHWEERLQYGRKGFWWKHGAKSLATHRRLLIWDFPDGVMAAVSLGVVSDEYSSRVLGKVKFKAKRDNYVASLLATHGLPLIEGEANARG